MLNKVKDEIQQDAEKKWIKNGHRGLIALCTGAGKSKIFVNIAVNNPKEKWLLVVPTEKLRDENWADEFIKWKKKIKIPIFFRLEWFISCKPYVMFYLLFIIQNTSLLMVVKILWPQSPTNPSIAVCTVSLMPNKTQ